MVKEPFAPVLFGPTIRSRDFTSIVWPFFFSPAKKPRTVCCLCRLRHKQHYAEVRIMPM